MVDAFTGIILVMKFTRPSHFALFQLCFKKFYSASSGVDQNTLYCDRNKINRRNVKSDVTSAYSQCREMFVLAVKSRVVAAAMRVLGMKEVNDHPKQNSFPPSLENGSIIAQRIYLRSVAENVVDKYVLDSSRINSFLDALLSEEEQQEIQRNQVQTPDGRYPCRIVGCNKTFKFDGRSRKNHEQSHDAGEALLRGLQVTSSTQPNRPPFSQSDDVYHYQTSLLQYGLMYLNFRDAVSEGDGARIIRSWKFFLIYFWLSGNKSKYALEALFLLFQVHSLLTPRQAHRLMWNRSVNNRGGPGRNVPLDLDLEHDNRYVKEACKKLGRNLTSCAVKRISHSTKIARELIEKFDTEIKIRARSGKHSHRSDQKDLDTLIDSLMKEDSMTETPGRKYKHFAHFTGDPMLDMDMSSLYRWITNHKRHILLNRKAR